MRSTKSMYDQQPSMTYDIGINTPASSVIYSCNKEEVVEISTVSPWLFGG